MGALQIPQYAERTDLPSIEDLANFAIANDMYWEYLQNGENEYGENIESSVDEMITLLNNYPQLKDSVRRAYFAENGKRSTKKNVYVES